MKNYRIAAIPGDGIGTEVIAAGLRVLDALAERDGGFGLEVENFDWGTDCGYRWVLFADFNFAYYLLRSRWA